MFKPGTKLEIPGYKASGLSTTPRRIHVLISIKFIWIGRLQRRMHTDIKYILTYFKNATLMIYSSLNLCLKKEGSTGMLVVCLRVFISK